MLRRQLTIVAVLTLLPSLLGAIEAGPDPLAGDPPGTGIVRDEADATGSGRYIVQFVDAPLATYDGSIEGLAATSPRVLGTTKLDTGSPASLAYLGFLERKHDAFELAVEQALDRQVEVSFDYRYAFNGLALELAPGEARTVATLPGVHEVQADYERKLLTDSGPGWIGAPGIWDGTATPDLSGTKGEGVVVGVIDTGINHDHPSFADVGGDGYDHINPRGQFYGLCDPLTGAPFCTDKLIGVWDFTGTTPLDHHGHGSHTASTSAGNHVLPATIEAPTIAIERNLSGVAPHANIISYKVCITSCPGVSLTAAIDQAVADEVDVINYSIGGGSSDPWNDSDAEGFLAAREAGVFVATSAGNSGPKGETIGSPADAPWVLSVGASTHDRAFVNAVAGMSGGATEPPADLDGKSFTAGYGPAPIVHAVDHGDGQCLNPFPPGTWDGEIVICDRGTIPRVDKGRNVAAGGAGGLVLSNTAAEGESTVADPHVIPAVHLGYSDGQLLEAWVLDGGDGHTASIAGTTADVADDNGDVMASFSSRGPNPAVPGVIKPDVTAPGVDVLAALASTDGTDASFGLMSGTSMSSPHAAGSAALVRAVHPDWTPAEVQSAITMTAVNDGIRDSDGSTPAGTFAFGGGRIDLGNAARAGFVLDETAANYRAADPDPDPSEGRVPGDPSALNLATLGYDGCEGTCTWTRTLESTLDRAVTYHVKTDVPHRVKLSVTPGPRFTLEPGQSMELTITAELDRRPVQKWMFGEVTFEPDDSAVPDAHFPVAIRPGHTEEVAIAATDTTGSSSYEYTAPIEIKNLSTQISGLRQGVLEEILLEQDPTPLSPYDTAIGTHTVLLDVPVGSRVISAATGSTTSQDLDLFIGKDDDGDGRPDAAEELCASTSPTAVESCNLLDPEGGTYWVMVQNWLSGRVVDDVELVATVIPGQDAGNLEVASDRTSADAGETLHLTLSWEEPALQPGTTWFGLVEFGSDPSTSNDVGALLVRLSRE